MEVSTRSAAAPQDKRTANDFGVLKFAATTTHGVNPMPEQWRGREIEIYVTGGDLHWGFTTNASAEIDRSVSAAAAGSTTQGASMKVGAILPDGNYDRAVLPNIGDPVYFVREASASVTVYIRLINGLNSDRG